MSSAFYVVFCFPFFLVSNNTDRAGCKHSCAGLDEERGIEKGKGGREKGTGMYVCINPGVSLKQVLASKVDLVTYVTFFSRLKSLSLNKEWSSSYRREIVSTNTSECCLLCRQRLGCTVNGFILHSNNLRML